jgi:cation:H+ antiporter
MTTILQFVGGFVLLLFGAEYLVRGAVSVARRLKVTPMIIGMTIVAYGTTSPELVVSVQAAIDGAPGISVGNVVGSNIANILLILGVSAVIFPIVVKPKALYRDAAMMLAAALLFTALALSGSIERWQGGLMVAALVVFSAYAFRSERRRGKTEGPGELAEEFKDAPQAPWLAALSVLGGLVAVVAGARLLVTAAVDTAQTLGVSEAVIGLTIVAVGTSLPEFATAVVAALRRHSDVAVGNIMGAGIYNLLAIMGIVAVVAPVGVPPQILIFDLWVMIGVTVALIVLLLWRRGLDRTAGATFVCAFAAYTALQYFGVDRFLSTQVLDAATAAAR